MDIARLLTRDDAVQSDHEATVGAVDSASPVLVSHAPPPKMELARLLNRDDSEPSDHETVGGIDNSTPLPAQRAAALASLPRWTVTPTPSSQLIVAQPPPQRNAIPAPPPQRAVVPVHPSQRAVARPRPPRPRKPSTESLQARVDALQLVIDHLPHVLRDLDYIVPPAFASTSNDSEDNDAESQRIRAFLKRTVVLTVQAHKEIAIRTEYLRLQKHHYESTANLRTLMLGVELNEWHWMSERWRAITLEYYVPLSHDQCFAIVEETRHAIQTYTLPEGTQETSKFGWRDSVHLDPGGLYVRFMIRKTLPQTDMQQLVDHKWSHYTDGDAFKKAHLGDNCDFFHQVLQRVSPDVMVIQRMERYPNLAELTHSLALVFRVKTGTGYLLVFRCIESPQLQGMMKADGLTLCGTFTWETFDVVQQDETDAIQFTTAGSIGSDNPAYAKRWRDDLVSALVRYETQLPDTPTLPIEAAAEEVANNLTGDDQTIPGKVSP